MKHLLFISVFIFSVKSYSQDTVRTSLIIFDNEDLTKVTKGDEKYNGRKNALKINPFIYLRGELPIYYERALNDNFSLEAAIGLTFKDYSSGLFEGFSNDNNSYDSDKAEEKVTSNPSFKMGIRYYTGGIVMDGFYFAVEYAKRNYTTEVTIRDEVITPNGVSFSSSTFVYNFKEEANHNEIKLIVGSQEHYYWDNIFMDYYIGVGIDKYSEKKVEAEFSTVSSQIDYILKSKEETVPRFYLGFKLGFEF